MYLSYYLYLLNSHKSCQLTLVKGTLLFTVTKRNVFRSTFIFLSHYIKNYCELSQNLVVKLQRRNMIKNNKIST